MSNMLDGHDYRCACVVYSGKGRPWANFRRTCTCLELQAKDAADKAERQKISEEEKSERRQTADVAAALREALAAIAAIEQNPLDLRRFELTKRSAAATVRAAMEKLGVTE